MARDYKNTADGEEADDAEKALDLRRSNDFDVTFLNIEMSGKDGITLAKEIRAIKSALVCRLAGKKPPYWG